MRILLSEISLPELRRHPWRYVLTAGAIFLGVAMFLAVRVASVSLSAALADTINRIAGETVLEVTAGSAGVPPSALDRARQVRGVTVAPVVSSVVHTAGPSPASLLLLGIDLVSDPRLRRYAPAGSLETADLLAVLQRPDSLIVARSFAARRGLHQGDPLVLATPLGERRFVIRGLLADRGVARAFGGNFAVLSVAAAAEALGRGYRFDRLDVAAAPGVRIADARARLAAALGPGYQIEPPLRRGRQTESLMDAFSLILALSSLMALLVGVFLIFNAFASSVAERRRQIGVLRALGVTAGEVERWFLAESLLLGLGSSLLAVPVGLVLGRFAMLGIALVVEQTYGVGVQVGGLVVEPLSLAVALTLGCMAAVAGGFLPARAAARTDPSIVLQQGSHQVAYLREGVWRRAGGAAGVVLALLLGGDGQPLWRQGLGLAVLFAGLTLLVPTFSHLLARLFKPLLRGLFGIEGQLASDSLIRAPRRTSATVAALTFALAFVISSASQSAGIRTSLLAWIRSAINPDILVSASPSFTARAFQLPESLRGELRRLPGVRQVDALRITSLDATARSPLLVSVEMDQYLRRSTPILEEGRLGDLLPAMLRDGVLISNNYARLHHLHRGDTLPLATPAGRFVFRVTGVQVDYTSENGSLLIDRGLYRRLWGDDRVDTFELMLAPGVDPESVRRDLYARLGEGRSLFVLTNREFKEEVFRLANQFWLLTYAQLIVAVGVGALGIVNALNVSVVERRREIAIFRALGAEARRVRSVFVLEAMTIGAVALVLGTLVGSTLGHSVINSVGGAVTGWVFPYEFPWGVVLASIPVLAVLCGLAAWIPAVRAARAPIPPALGGE